MVLKYGQISRHGVSETAPGDILLAFGIEDLPHYIQSKILLVGLWPVMAQAY